MPLTAQQIKEIKYELDNCKNPLFFFHDDPDGFCSFLLLYQYVKEGHGTPVKSVPKVDEKFLRKVQEYQPDKIFIVDLAMVAQEFIDLCKVPIIWIDHHEPLDRDKVKYYNPRCKDPDKNTPATYLCNQIVEGKLWIAATGCIGDWYIPDFMDKVREKYPKLAPIKTKNPPELLFDTDLGKLARIFSFILKGKIGDVMKCVKIMTRIDDPYDILDQKTSQGRFIYQKYEKMNERYQKLYEGATKDVTDDKLLVFTYSEREVSFTGDLSNELLYRYPDKVIIIGREKDDEVRMSLRSSKIVIRDVLNEALKHVEGYGGGHEHACGACVKKADFEHFLKILSKEIS